MGFFKWFKKNVTPDRVLDAVSKLDKVVDLWGRNGVLTPSAARAIGEYSSKVAALASEVKKVKDARERRELLERLADAALELQSEGLTFIKNPGRKAEFIRYVTAVQTAIVLL